MSSKSKKIRKKTKIQKPLLFKSRMGQKLPQSRKMIVKIQNRLLLLQTQLSAIKKWIEVVQKYLYSRWAASNLMTAAYQYMAYLSLSQYSDLSPQVFGDYRREL